MKQCWDCCGLRFRGEVCPNCGGVGGVIVGRDMLSLGEGNTPLYKSRVWSNVWIKDERQNPTGTFKDRQAAAVVLRAYEWGATDIVVASAGSTAVACAAYATRVGFNAWVFLPSRHRDRVEGAAERVEAFGAHVTLVVASTLEEVRAVAKGFADERGFFFARGMDYADSMAPIATEIFDRLGHAPDWYVQSVSGGLGPVGILRQFEELGGPVPKLLAGQDAGCAPMAHSFRKGLREVEAVLEPLPYAPSLGTGEPVEAYRFIRASILEHGGGFVVVNEKEADAAMRRAALREGIEMGRAAAVGFAALGKAFADGLITDDEVVVINCTGR